MAEGPLWTEAEDKRLLELWSERYRTTEIARTGEFPGRTRNAIIGRINRLRRRLGSIMVASGNEGRPAVPVKKKRIRRKPDFAVKRPASGSLAAPAPEQTPAVPPAARQLTLLELGPTDCRFIVSGSYTRQHLYCAADATGNVDSFGNNCYCSYHRRLMRSSGPR